MNGHLELLLHLRKLELVADEEFNFLHNTPLTLFDLSLGQHLELNIKAFENLINFRLFGRQFRKYNEQHKRFQFIIRGLDLDQERLHVAEVIIVKKFCHLKRPFHRVINGHVDLVLTRLVSAK